MKTEIWFALIGLIVPFVAAAQTPTKTTNSSVRQILDNIKDQKEIFLVRGDDEFGYVLWNNSLVQMKHIINEIQRELINEFTVLSADIKRLLLQKAGRYANNLEALKETALKINEKLSLLNSTIPKVFVKQFIHFVNELEISLSTTNFKTFLNYIEFINYVESFSGTSLFLPPEILELINDNKKYLDDSTIWYRFLSELHDKLSSYDVQKKSSSFDGSKLMKLNAERILPAFSEGLTERPLGDFDLKSIFDDIDPIYYKTIENLQINVIKLRLLQAIWKQTMQTSVSKDCSTTENKLRVKGYNVLISDVMKSNCWSSASYVEIFALNKVFFDADIDKPSTSLHITSPIWEIVLDEGTQYRQIKLNGIDAVELTEPAKNSTKLPERLNGELVFEREDLKYPERGEHGKPGQPGGSAGQFFGIGQAINDKNLQIELIGGKGANGQDGGNGKNNIF